MSNNKEQINTNNTNNEKNMKDTFFLSKKRNLLPI